MESKTTLVSLDANSASSSRLRQIDTLIAEKIFGMFPCDKWVSVNFGSAGGPGLSHGTFKEPVSHEGKCYSTREVESMFGDFGGPLHYTTDPRACKELREKLAERWDWQRLCCYLKGTAFTFRIRGLTEHEQFIAEACSEEMAVALCALKAYGIDLPKELV